MSLARGEFLRRVTKAGRTLSMNLTVDFMVPRLRCDLSLGVIPLNSYTRIGGRVNILKIIKKNVVKMNCAMVVNITSQGIQDQICNRRCVLS